MVFFILALIMSTLFSQDQHLISHRAADLSMSENTMESLKKMEERGANWFEIDCHLMADGNVAVIHDKRLKRTTTGKGSITKQTKLSLLDVFVLGGGAQERIPMLEELLDYAYSKNLHIMVEVKGRDFPLVDRVHEILSAYDTDLFVVYSFERKVVQAFLEKEGGYEVRWSIKKFSPGRLQKAKKLGVSLNLDTDYLKKEHIDAIYKEGMNAHVFTVNSEERAQELF